jgi:membrane protease YdiL (CAAX protease family)
MSIPTTTPPDVRTGPSSSTGPVRRWVSRHPLAAFTAIVFGAGWPVLAVPALTAHGLVPGGALPDGPFVLAAVLLVMLPAALGVTAVVDGRAGVRELLARAFRWRFGAGWWAAVVLGLPVATVLVGIAAGRSLQLDDLGAVLLDALLSVGSAIVLVNLWEETVWAGFLQTRLQARSGFWPAALLTAVAFAGFHVPLQLLPGGTAADAAFAIGALFVLGLLVRVMVGVVLTATGGSVLAVAVLHAAFNASNSEDDVVDRVLSGGVPLSSALIATVVVTVAAALALRTPHGVAS